MPLSQPDSNNPHAERLVDVLARIQTELEAISARIDRNQALIAQATWDLGSSDAAYVSAMQDADLSAQRIAGVAGFLRALGEASEPNWFVDTRAATSGLTLDELVQAIGTAEGTASQKNEDASGEVDFF